jgi:ABC-type multidrug transport system fused ATPase/permease subunit
MNKYTFSPYTALSLKVVGIILILSALLSYVVAAIPFNPSQQEWQIQYVNQLVNQGFLPLVGMTLMIIGYWIDDVGGTSQRRSLDLRLPIFILASLLGLIFLLIIPFHLNNISQRSAEAFAEIETKAEQFEAQIQNETQQLQALVENEEQFAELEEAIESGQVQGEQLQQLQLIRQQVQQLRDDPQAIEEQVQTARTELLAQKEEAEQEERTKAFKSVLAVGLSSLLLAIGYVVVGWMGFKSLGSGLDTKPSGL